MKGQKRTFYYFNTREMLILKGIKNRSLLPVKGIEKRVPISFYGLIDYSNGEGIRRQGAYNQPANLYYLQSGYFCKREWELEKATHIPFRFRLGSLADCNALEGKH